MYECFHCGSRSIVWQSDFMASEFWGNDEENDGIVHVCTCANCGAEIIYTILDKKEE